MTEKEFINTCKKQASIIGRLTARLGVTNSALKTLHIQVGMRDYIQTLIDRNDEVIDEAEESIGFRCTD